MTIRTCSGCSETKAPEDFPRKKSSPDGLSRICHLCNRAKVTAWRLANPDRKREADLNWRLSNPERKKQDSRRWYENNRDYHAALGRLWAQQNRERVRHIHREWSSRNADKVMAGTRKRQAAIQQRCGLLTAEGQAQIVSIYAEAQRLTKETGIAHHVDHIAPLRGKTVSGLHVPGNLRIILASENHQKGSKVDLALIEASTMEAWF